MSLVTTSRKLFRASELNTIRQLINTHRVAILEAWHEHCG